MPDVLAYLQSPAGLSTWAIVANTSAFVTFGIDKIRAEAGQWRISESTLLLLALLGGTPGAYAARRAFRHKTRKQPFSSQLHAIAVLQVAALAWFLLAPAGWSDFLHAQLVR